MALKRRIIFTTLVILAFIMLSACSVNPFRADNELTGSATGTAVGAAAGAGTVILAKGSQAEMVLGGLAGGALGYYVTSLPFKAGGVTHVGGHVYTLGDYVTIEIPSDRLFDVNSADFLPEAGAVLDSTVAVLKRYPKNSIMISGNTSGFGTPRMERKLSEARAQQIAAYMWAHGISNDNISNPHMNMGSMKDFKRYTRELTYVGYGSYFPIANNITAQGVRENSRIQITAYPSYNKIKLHECGPVYHFGYMESSGPPTSETFNEVGNQNQISSYNPPQDKGYSPVGDDNDIKMEMADSYNRVVAETPCSTNGPTGYPCPTNSVDHEFRQYKN